MTDLPDIIRTGCAAQGFGSLWSNAIWGTKYTSATQKEPGVATNNSMDWDAARTTYFTALTANDPGRRDEELAKTFQALGQILHLVQDLAVPAHVRDDFMSHMEYFDPGLTLPDR